MTVLASLTLRWGYYHITCPECGKRNNRGGPSMSNFIKEEKRRSPDDPEIHDLCLHCGAHIHVLDMDHIRTTEIPIT